MTDPRDMVIEFHHTFQPSTDIRLWTRLIEEETVEVLDAMREDDKLNCLKEISDLSYVILGFMLVTPEDEAALSQAEWLEIQGVMEEAEVAVEAAMNMYGFNSAQTREAFLRVHESNMSKLGEDGKPIRREDGKILKGSNYREPDLTDLILST